MPVPLPVKVNVAEVATGAGWPELCELELWEQLMATVPLWYTASPLAASANLALYVKFPG